MKTIIDVTIVDACEEDVLLVGEIVRKTLPGHPVLVHDQDVIVKALNPLPNEMLLAKYWIAKEMAESVYWSASEVGKKYWHGNYYFDSYLFINRLSQILKKERC